MDMGLTNKRAIKNKRMKMVPPNTDAITALAESPVIPLLFANPSAKS